MARDQQQTAKPALVTGAGSGLGRAFCLRLAREGAWHVIVADVDQEGAAETLEEIRRHGAAGETAVFDVRDESAWKDLSSRVEQRWSSLRLLVNNAGACASGVVAEGGEPHAEPDAWRRLMELHYFGTLYGCRTFVPAMQAAGRGAVINVASIAGWLAVPGMGAYNASKAAVVSLTETLHGELRGSGVNVTLVGPGFFQTRLLERGEFAHPAHRSRAEELAASSGFTAEDVVEAALRTSRKNRLYSVVGWRARLFWRWKRMAPASLAGVLSDRYRRLMAQDAVAGDDAAD
ncbi:MAG: SDR family NAD(P)-dependent oxidoreductase [Planctomycetota bacterium]